MKCLPQHKIRLAKGTVLHDWHAEILAIRAFDRFLLDECADLAAKGQGSIGQWVRRRRKGELLSSRGSEEEDERDQKPFGQQPFTIKDDVSIHMYCSEAPCGDASMELVMAEQVDATPWTHDSASASMDNGMLGRGHFDQLGIVRRKPARPDAPQTLSKSCSDKLAFKQCKSLLSSLTSSLIYPENAYLSTLVLPEMQYVPEAVERAFGATGRMARVADAKDIRKRWRRWGYRFQSFDVETTTREFEYSKRNKTPETGSPAAESVQAAPVPSNISALSTPQRQEILINGVLQGRKQLDPKGASCASRKSLWKAALDVALLAGLPNLAEGLKESTYFEVKAGEGLTGREVVKSDVRELALRDWKRNVGDGDWSLEDG